MVSMVVECFRVPPKTVQRLNGNSPKPGVL